MAGPMPIADSRGRVVDHGLFRHEAPDKVKTTSYHSSATKAASGAYQYETHISLITFSLIHCIVRFLNMLQSKSVKWTLSCHQNYFVPIRLTSKSN